MQSHWYQVLIWCFDPKSAWYNPAYPCKMSQTGTACITRITQGFTLISITKFLEFLALVLLSIQRRPDPWWRHQTFSALLAIYAGNSPVTSEFPAQRPVTRSFDVFFDLRLNGRLSKQRETGNLRRHRAHYDVTAMPLLFYSEVVSAFCGSRMIAMNKNPHELCIWSVGCRALRG